MRGGSPTERPFDGPARPGYDLTAIERAVSGNAGVRGAMLSEALPSVSQPPWVAGMADSPPPPGQSFPPPLAIVAMLMKRDGMWLSSTGTGWHQG